jgi:hypothetical protein
MKADGGFQHLSERAGIDEIFLLPDIQFVVQQLLQQLHSEIALAQMFYLGQEFIL